MWRQPKAVWAVAFASVIAFMGIGLVDPILKPIADNLNATPSQVSLLFTSYMAVMGRGHADHRRGVQPHRTQAHAAAGAGHHHRRAGLAGMSDTVMGIVGWRALWGLGNALFIATALATIVSSARGSVAQAIILYEAALGLGIAVGPLVGGVLGSISWRGPFFGVSALMAVALVVTAVLLPSTPRPPRATTLADPFRALRHRGLLGVAITALLYNFGFFTLLAFTPFPLDMTAHQIGLIFFGWGLCPGVHLGGGGPAAAGPVRHRADAAGEPAVHVGGARGDGDRHRPQGRAGGLRGGGRAVHRRQQHADHRDGVMKSAAPDRSDGVASAAYSFVRFGGAALAPWLAGFLGERFGAHLPFWVGAAAVLGAAGVLGLTSRHLSGIDIEEDELEQITEQATAVTVGNDS